MTPEGDSPSAVMIVEVLGYAGRRIKYRYFWFTSPILFLALATA